MYIKKITILISLLLWLSFTTFLAANEKTKMFPKAENGYTKYIIDVPKTANDFDHKLEVIIGQDMMVDCNNHRIIAQVEERDLKGWGYSYLYITSDSNNVMISTRRACTNPKEKKFVQVYNESLLKRYNSRLPIVVYVPNHLTVKYRIWSASDELKSATKD